MSREIKFRGKSSVKGWLFGDLLQMDNKTSICVDNGEGFWNRYVIDDKTVGQYIGVLDKNGKEIYEDDIVMSDDGKVGQVQWFEEHLAFMIWCVTDNKVYFAYDNDFSKVEVIGNVYENADLLEEVEESEVD